jgi:glycosyltransferase involved in cell wall biosynthesis
MVCTSRGRETPTLARARQPGASACSELIDKRQRDSIHVRVLSILPFPALPLTHGGRVRAYQLAVGLARAGANVDLAGPWRPGQPPRPFERQAITIRPFVFVANLLPASLGDWIVPPLLQLSYQPFTVGPKRLLQRSREYDIVEFHFCAYASWMSRVAPGTRVVYSAHNVELDYAVGEPASRLTRIFGRRIGVLERRAMQASDLVVACTETDGKRLTQLYGSPKALAVISNGFDGNELWNLNPEREATRAQLGLRPEELAILFVGGPALHNRRAVEFLEEELLPRLDRPVRLILAGECTRPRRNGRVVALGYVDKLLPLLAAADVAVNPIESGSGSNLKLAEYLAAGIPVVTTALGLRGYEAFAHLVTVAELDDFADALRTVDRSVDRPEALADLSWNALGRRLYEVYTNLLTPGPRPLPLNGDTLTVP